MSITQHFYSNWRRDVPININELSIPSLTQAPDYKDREALTELLCSLPGVDFKKEMKQYYMVEKPKLNVKVQQNGLPSTMQDITLPELLLYSYPSLLIIAENIFGMKKDDIDSLFQAFSSEIHISALIFLLEKKRKNSTFSLIQLNSVNGYKQVKQLGKGTYGTVYLVEKNGVQYADKEMSSLELNELDILCRFDHPNISQALDFFEAGGKNHIILELAESDLYKTLDGLPEPDYATRVMWCYQMASALWFYHKQGYYHCDFKPENVLIRNGNAIMADFGLAFPNEAEQPFCGTPTWTAPEGLQPQHHGKSKWYAQKLEHQLVDVFSLGLCFALVLSDIKLIEYHNSIADSYEHFFQHQIQLISYLGVSSDWERLITKMCDPDTSKRMRTLDEVLAHPAFIKDGYIAPISGMVKQIKFPICSSSEQSAMVQLCTWLLMISTYELHMLTAYMGISILRRVSLLYPKDKKLVAAASMFVAQQLMYDVEHIEPSGWVQILGIGDKEAQKLQDMSVKIPSDLKGQIRSKSVYDYAVSEEEALYGIYYLCSCVDVTPEELHSEYLKYETTEQMQNRTPKSIRMSQLKLRTDIPMSLLKIQNTKEFKLLGPMLSYICVTEPSMFMEEMAIKRLNDVTSTLKELLNASNTIQTYN